MTNKHLRSSTSPNKNNLDTMSLAKLDEWYSENLKQYEKEDGSMDFGSEPNAEFYAKLEQYERYLEVRNKLLARQPVVVKEVVADADAVSATLKTYHAINNKIQKAIAEGQVLDSNDIRLLVEMMKALNGDK